MSILVAYATHSGATTTLAETMVEEFAAQGIEAQAVNVKDDPDPSAHRAVVLGSGIRMEAIEKSAVNWVHMHRRALTERPVAFFTCSGSASDPSKAGQQKATDEFLGQEVIAPVAVRNFPGWVILEKIPHHERVLMRAMRVKLGDFRDLDAVKAWAREILPALNHQH